MRTHWKCHLGPLSFFCQYNFLAKERVRCFKPYATEVIKRHITYEVNCRFTEAIHYGPGSNIFNQLLSLTEPNIKIKIKKNDKIIKDQDLISRVAEALSGGHYDIEIFTDYARVINYKLKRIDEYFSSETRRRLVSENSFYPLNTLLPKLLPKHGCFLLHSACVADNQKNAIVFIAKSGGGKSTAVILAKMAGFEIIGDDKMIYLKKNNRFFAIWTPFNRVYDQKTFGMIKGIFLLKKGPNFQLKRVNVPYGISKIWSDNANQWLPLNTKMRIRLFKLYWDMLLSTQIYELTFRKDYIDFDLIRKVVL